jgi:hypothetical protein
MHARESVIPDTISGLFECAMRCESDALVGSDFDRLTDCFYTTQGA